MPNFNLPHLFKDGVGETASGAQVIENETVLKEKVEALENNGVAGTVPGALVARAANTDYLAHATKKTLVMLIVTCQAASSLTVFVGGVPCAGCGSEGSSQQTVTFPVPAGVTWKYTAANIAEARSSYQSG